MPEKMSVSIVDRQAKFYVIENCESCGLKHIIYERDVHRLINSDTNNFVFICPHDNTCVELSICEQCDGTGEVETNNQDCIACNGTGRNNG